MLKTFRKHRKSFFGFIVVGLMGLFMIPFGINMFSGQGNQGAAITVGENEISSREYYNQLRRTQEMFRQQLGANYAKFSSMFNLEQRTIDELIDGVLLKNLISSLDLSASTQQIESQIASHPFFNGNVSRQSLDIFVRSQGLTPAGLELRVKEQIAREQLETMFGQLSVPTKAELESAFRDEQRQASFNYIAFTPSEFEKKVTVENDEPLEAYFVDHAEAYRKPRAVAFQYVAFKPADFHDKVEVTEEDIKDLYGQQRHSYFEPKKILLRQIIIQKEEPKEKKSAVEEAFSLDSAEDKKAEPLESALPDENKPKTKAENILAKLDAGVPFAEVAQSSSEDKATAKDGGLMGWMQYKQLENKLRNAAALLEKGDHSELIETDQAFHILYAEDKKEKRQKPLEEVRAQLERKLKQGDAPVYAQAEAEAFLQAWLGKSSEVPLDAFAAEEKRESTTTPKALEEGESSPGIPDALIKKVSKFSEGTREIVQIDDVTYVVEATSVKDSYIPEFKDVRKEILEAYHKKEAKILAKSAAQEALSLLHGETQMASSGNAGTPEVNAEKKVTEKKTLKEVASIYGLSVETSPLSTRAAATGALFTSPENKRTAFTLSESAPTAKELLTSGESNYVVELASSTTPDEKEFNNKEEELRTRESKRSGTRLMNSLMKSLRANTEIWVNPDLLNKETS